MSADGDRPFETGASSARKAPRAPTGATYNDIVREWAKTEKIPDFMFIDKSEWLGDEGLDPDRYITKEAYELEKEKIWKKVWQMACREEQIPDVGDAITYEICDMSFLVVRVTPTEIKAYYNVCLHQGRLLRDPGTSHNTELRCPFHGFCWKLDGKLMHFPSQWDFPQIDKAKFNLREVKVGKWGGFVFINMDPNCESFESYIGDLGMHFESAPLEDRYIAAHTAKIFPANWKVAQEAFMEAYHNIFTHPQFSIYTAGAADQGQYDPMGNYSRAMGQGEWAIPLAYQPTAEERVAAICAVGHPDVYTNQLKAGPIGDIQEQYKRHGQIKRETLRKVIGDKIDKVSTAELSTTGYFTVFPNFHPWMQFDEFTYRFRPYKEEPEISVMETYLLRPFKGERPKPAKTTWLGLDQSHMDAEDLGAVAQIFSQDEYNIPSVQKGLHNMKASGLKVQLGLYQATKIRHFHKLWDKWVYGK